MNTVFVFPVRCKKNSSTKYVGHIRLLFILFSAICLLGVSARVLAQTQLGFDIVAEMSRIESNSSVSLSSDGNRLAVGARDNDDNGSRSGHVRVHEWSGTAWVQIGDDIDGEAADDMSGQPVSLSSDGTRVAISAVFNDGNGADSGHVRVYQWSGTAWTQLGSDIDGEAAGDKSGSISLSSDGNRLAIGAPHNGDNLAYSSQMRTSQDNSGHVLATPNDAGHVRVYQWSGAAWIQLGVDIDGEAAGDRSGRSVSLSSDGNRLAIGSPNSDINGSGSGQVRVYQWSGTVWALLGLNINGGAASYYFGISVSLSSDGNRLAVGATAYDYGNAAGLVRIYQWSGTAWEQLGADIEGEAEGDGAKIVALSSDGNRLAIGAGGNDTNAVGSGQVRIFQWTGSAWMQLGSNINGYLTYDYFGTHVSLSSDGNRVASATGNANAIAERLNRARVYDLSMFNVFNINPGLNDAWYYEPTSGQGFFITVFPDLGAVSLAWFTYDTELPPLDALANLGDPGHRWLTAVGPIDGNQVIMEIEMTSGGIFDSASIIERTDPPGSDGTIILTFESCNSATIEYEIPSINRQGIIPIKRVANDNIVICEALSSD
jgi:hypothetical protein